MNNLKTNFQEIHYAKRKPNFLLACGLFVAELGYKVAINLKNFLYDIKILKEHKVGPKVVCVGNLTTGGVGKTPIVIALANEIAKEKKVAVISRGYGAKISNKNPTVIKDSKGLKFKDGTLCADEPYQIAKKVSDSVVVITCANRKKAAEFAIIKYGVDIIILDDGFSNRKLKKDKTIIAIDSKMRFGNNHLLPFGPLREPISQVKRADEIILVDKGDKNIEDAVLWAKNTFKLPLKISKMIPSRIYNLDSGANVKLNKEQAVAFCAIGQPEQFFDFAKKYYEIETVAFDDHHQYTKTDIEKLIKIAKENNINTFITTQKDETKLYSLVKDIKEYSFNVLELKVEIEKVD
ncbi:tetraacyldisaccharide 4'-kinase [bacterium]|nr:tetraacyldisaccharide 4'-kinase [bacterium]